MSSERPLHIDASPGRRGGQGGLRITSGWYAVRCRGRDDRRAILAFPSSPDFHIYATALQVTVGDGWVIDDERALWTGPFRDKSAASRWLAEPAPPSGNATPADAP